MRADPNKPNPLTYPCPYPYPSNRLGVVQRHRVEHCAAPAARLREIWGDMGEMKGRSRGARRGTRRPTANPGPTPSPSPSPTPTPNLGEQPLEVGHGKLCRADELVLGRVLVPVPHLVRVRARARARARARVRVRVRFTLTHAHLDSHGANCA